MTEQEAIDVWIQVCASQGVVPDLREQASFLDGFRAGTLPERAKRWGLVRHELRAMVMQESDA